MQSVEVEPALTVAEETETGDQGIPDPRVHGNFVWRTLQRHGLRQQELDDALQEVFLVAHRKQQSFDPSRGKFSTWLFGICARVAWAQRRRRPAWAELPELIDQDTPEAAWGRKQRLSVLSEALNSLSPEHRATFVLFEIEGQSCAEIAELSGVPVGTVHSRLHAARRALRKALEAKRTSHEPSKEAAGIYAPSLELVPPGELP